MAKRTVDITDKGDGVTVEEVELLGQNVKVVGVERRPKKSPVWESQFGPHIIKKEKRG